MKGRIDEFLQIQNEKNRVAKNIFSKLNSLGYSDDLLQQYKDRVAVEQIILDLKPNSPRAITTICSLLSAYAKFTGNEDAYYTIQSIDRNILWRNNKANVSKRYISHETFLDVVHDINMYEELNAVYYQALFRIIYEGIYNDDMSVISNLKASDIHGNTVTLHTEDTSYEMELPSDLIEDLKELAESNKWQRKNRYGVFELEVSGKCTDACFKIESRENRKNNPEAYYYQFGYYNKLRKIAKEYLEGYNIVPLRIFVSGIMHRICTELERNNIDIEDAFSDRNKNRLVSIIITNELNRCNYHIEVKAFREQVKGHLEIFKN